MTDELTAEQLAEYGRIILAIVRGAPRQQRQLDTLAGEIGILIGDLCNTKEDADRLTQHLVEHPPPRWNFQDLRRRAIAFTAEPPPAQPERELTWYGFTIPEWAFEPTTKVANQLGTYWRQIDAEIWRRIEAATTKYRLDLEARARAMMAQYQQEYPESVIYRNPTPAQIRDRMIVFALKDHEAKHTAKPEPCPKAIHPTR